MSKYTNYKKDPVFQEQRDKLFFLCVETLFLPKSSKKYQDHLKELANLCGALSSNYHVNCAALANQMNEKMTIASNTKLTELKADLIHLNDVIKQTPINRAGFFTNEGAITKLIGERKELERRQNLPYEAIIKDIIHQTFILAVAKGIDIKDLSAIELTYSVSTKLDEASTPYPNKMG